MAVSNTIGSNVFDILVGLGVPWALQTMCVNYGSEVRSRRAYSVPRVHSSLTDPGSVCRVAGDDKQQGSAVLGGAPAGLRRPHGEHRLIWLARANGNFQRCNLANIPVWLPSS